MKRLLILTIVLFLLVTLAGCTQYDVGGNEVYDTGSYEEEIDNHYDHGHEEEIFDSVAPDQIRFSSVEDFLNAYIIANEGGDITNLVSRWETATEGDIASVTDSINFTSFEEFYLPVDIPDEFELHNIEITEEFVGFAFLHRDDMGSEEAVQDVMRYFRELHFGFARWDVDDYILFDAMMRQSWEQDILIDGKYLFRESELGDHTFHWISNRTRFWLHLPANLDPTGDRSETNELGGISLDDPHAMISFTETTTLNLQDTRAVETMIEELEAARR